MDVLTAVKMTFVNSDVIRLSGDINLKYCESIILYFKDMIMNIFLIFYQKIFIHSMVKRDY